MIQQLLLSVGVHPTCSVSRTSSLPGSPLTPDSVSIAVNRTQYVVPGSSPSAETFVLEVADTCVLLAEVQGAGCCFQDNSYVEQPTTGVNSTVISVC